MRRSGLPGGIVHNPETGRPQGIAPTMCRSGLPGEIVHNPETGRPQGIAPTMRRSVLLIDHSLCALVDEEAALDGFEVDEAFGVDVEDDNGFVAGVVVGAERDLATDALYRLGAGYLLKGLL